LRELKVNQRCSSPFIVKFFGSFVINGTTTAIAMEYCEGRSLEKVYKMMLTRGRKTKEKVLGKIACAVLGGLSYLHEQKIIHRGNGY
jgi:mitogen-activated protein kinase kinase